MTLVVGFCAHPCHLATAMIVLGALTRWRGHPTDSRFVWAMLGASVLIDLDHLPLEFGSSILTAGTPRPYTHALWVVAVLAGRAPRAMWAVLAIAGPDQLVREPDERSGGQRAACGRSWQGPGWVNGPAGDGGRPAAPVP